MLNREPQINFSLLSGRRMSARVTHASGELELFPPESLKLSVCSLANALINTALLTSPSETVGPWELSLSPTFLPTFGATMRPAVLYRRRYCARHAKSPLFCQYVETPASAIPGYWKMTFEKEKKCFHNPQTLSWVHSEVAWEEISLFACFHKAIFSLFFL